VAITSRAEGESLRMAVSVTRWSSTRNRRRR
jgi:hypothetical protein